MFRHCVLMRFEITASAAQRAAATDAILSLSDSIPEVQALTVGDDAGLREGNFDLAVVADFKDQAAYAIYASHPAHLEMLAEAVIPILSERAAVQFEF